MKRRTIPVFFTHAGYNNIFTCSGYNKAFRPAACLQNRLEGDAPGIGIARAVCGECLIYDSGRGYRKKCRLPAGMFKEVEDKAKRSGRAVNGSLPFDKY